MNYKQTEKYLTKLASEKYCKTLQFLKEFTPDETKQYTVVFRTDSQRKDHRESFKNVVFVQEQDSFLFDDKLPINMADVIEVIVKDKVSYADKLFEGLNQRK